MHHSIDIRNLSFSYPDGTLALNDVSMRIEPGEKVALVGPNGAGKSTLILHLNGILSGQGFVQVCSLAVVKENLSRVRSCVGLVFQSPEDQLFSPTVFDDVAFGPLYQGLPHDEVLQRVDQALEAVPTSSTPRHCRGGRVEGRVADRDGARVQTPRLGLRNHRR